MEFLWTVGWLRKVDIAEIQVGQKYQRRKTYLDLEVLDDGMRGEMLASFWRSWEPGRLQERPYDSWTVSVVGATDRRLALPDYFLAVGMKSDQDGLRGRTNTEEDFFFWLS